VDGVSETYLSETDIIIMETKTQLETIVSEIVSAESVRNKKIPVLPIVEIYNSYKNIRDPRMMREIRDYLYFDEYSLKL